MLRILSRSVLVLDLSRRLQREQYRKFIFPRNPEVKLSTDPQQNNTNWTQFWPIFNLIVDSFLHFSALYNWTTVFLIASSIDLRFGRNRSNHTSNIKLSTNLGARPLPPQSYKPGFRHEHEAGVVEMCATLDLKKLQLATIDQGELIKTTAGNKTSSAWILRWLSTILYTAFYVRTFFSSDSGFNLPDYDRITLP